MNDLLTSVIRTVVPQLVGFVLAILARASIRVDDEFITNLTLLLQLSLSTLYYISVRLWEKNYPKAGWLLGVARQPEYKR